MDISRLFYFKKRIGIGVLLVGVFVLGFFIGRQTGKVASPAKVVRFDEVRKLSVGNSFINPLVLCDVTDPENPFEELSAIKEALYASVRKTDPLIATTSVYFRDLNTGHWVGVNEDEKFAPASILKVPTMIAILYAAEHSNILSDRIFFDGSFDENKDEYFTPLRSIQPKASYSVDELLRYMMAYSDNNARRLLHEHLDKQLIEQVYADLGLDLPSDNAKIDFMSAKTLSRIFRALYNATYLSNTMSEKALRLLSEPDFPEGIQGGVPAKLTVAQKYGERTTFRGDNVTVDARELHDCGIVYYPQRPYLLCVMTKGSNFDAMAKRIKAISYLVYTRLNEIYH